jgi:proline iminopeptidase
MPLSGFADDVASYFFGVLAPHYDLRPRLKDISAPTLVIVGRYDWICPPAASRILAAGIPKRLAHRDPGGRALQFLREPRAFCDTVRDFLGRTLCGTG